MTKASWFGLAATLALVAAAVVLPLVSGWDVHARADRSDAAAPLHAFWAAKVGPGTVPAVLLAVLGVRWGPTLAWRLGWRHLLWVSYAAALAWLLSLALVDGVSGISRVLGNSSEYLRTARQVTSVHDLLEVFVSRIPKDAGPLNWPTHVAGHPPGMLLFFVLLVRLGLGGDLAAGLVVVAIAATIPAAVLSTLHVLGREDAARRVAPFLVLTPAAVWLAVSADAVMAAIFAWGLAALATATQRAPRTGWLWAVLAGLLFGSVVMMSYGLVLAGVVALALLVVTRQWWPVPVVAAAALAVVLGFAVSGFQWWQAYPHLIGRYWDGIASARPAAYWVWGDLAALAISAGPIVGAGLAATWARWRDDSVVVALVSAAAVAVLVADLSQMSKAEVERIWLPFVPWLTLGVVFLPERWRGPALAVQVLTALAVQHLLYTSW